MARHILVLLGGALLGAMHASVAEARRVLDAHVHLTNTSQFSYSGWSNSSAGACPCAPPCACDWSIPDWMSASSNVSSKLVFIEVDADDSQYLSEATWVQSTATAPGGYGDLVGAIVSKQPPGFGTLAVPDATIAANLDTLKAQVPLLRGIRTYMDFTNFSQFDAAVRHTRLLGERGLLLEICLGGLGGNTAATSFVIQLVREVPQTRFILDHLGSPPVLGSAANMTTWYETVSALASLPNVYAKVGGAFQYYKPCLTCPATFPSVSQVAPLVEHVLRSFSFQRCIYEGNWFFVDWWYGNDLQVYAKWFQYLSDILASYQPTPTATELDDLYYATGVMAYNVLTVD